MAVDFSDILSREQNGVYSVHTIAESLQLLARVGLIPPRSDVIPDVNFESDRFTCVSKALVAVHAVAKFTLDGASRFVDVAEGVSTWMKDITRGLLYRPVALPPTTDLALASALYVKGVWETPFDPSDNVMVPFKDVGDVECMCNTLTNVEVAESPYAVSIFLPFEGDAGMIFVLPDEDVNMQVYANGRDLHEHFSVRQHYVGLNITHKDVNLVLPKFNLYTELDLRSALQRLGIIVPNLTAAISAMSLHVNEAGCEAGAAAVLGLKLGAAPHWREHIELRFDRPFFFSVIGKNKYPLTFGVVYNPKERV